MKKLLFFAVLAGIVLAGCSNDNNETPDTLELKKTQKWGFIGRCDTRPLSQG